MDSAQPRGPNRRSKPSGEVIKTWVFDSVGPRKYALQLRRASNGNPCLRLVEGVPREDGSFAKFHVTVWSEDFRRFGATLDEARAYIRDRNIRTPHGHKWTPSKRGKGSRPAASHA